MQITDAVPIPTFSHHESFHPRYGWLKKAYDHVSYDGSIFQHDDAPVRLGVGKNMVRAIRFWGIATKIIKYADVRTKNKKMITTDMGEAIFNDKGLDPYIENPDTLWLLHWLLFARPSVVPVWWLMINEFSPTNIKIEEITEWVTERITNIQEWQTPSPKSIKKDVDVFIHTYTTRKDKMAMEDYLDCPFRHLQIVRQRSRNEMRFAFGRKHGLSPLMVAFACLDFIGRDEITSKNVSVSKLATEPGSVGHVFKILESDLADMLTDATRDSKSISIQNVNGAPHLTYTGSAKDSATDVLGQIYGKDLALIPKRRRVMEKLLP